MARTGTWMQRLRVPLGFLCGAIFLIFAEPSWRTLTLGGAIAIVGLGLRAWAAGHIRKNAELAVSGPYAWTRNPLYLGSFILGLGFTVAAGRFVLGILFALLFLGIYLPVMRTEAQTMFELFGEAYTIYARHVPLFFPRVTGYKEASSSRLAFDQSLYMRYREYQAMLGSVIAWSILALKAAFLS